MIQKENCPKYFNNTCALHLTLGKRKNFYCLVFPGVCVMSQRSIVLPVVFYCDCPENNYFLLNSRTVLQVFKELVCCCFPAVGLFFFFFYWTICWFVHGVMWGNNSWRPPGGDRHTADGQPGSYTVHKSWRSWGLAPPCGSWKTFILFCQSHVEVLLSSSCCYGH